MIKYIEDKYAGKRVVGFRTAQEVVHDRLVNLDHEEVWLIYLTSANTVIASEMIARGTLNQSSIDCRTILRASLLQNAASIVLAHNHPSGDPEPSKEDIIFTAKLNTACKLMDINLLDHVILAKESCYSFEQCKSYHY